MMCYKQLTVTRATARRCAPSTIEIMAVQNLNPIVSKVFFMDGKTKAVTLSSMDTTAELLIKVARKIGLQSVEGWAIYEVRHCLGRGNI